jgi:hypothetical protein
MLYFIFDRVLKSDIAEEKLQNPKGWISDNKSGEPSRRIRITPLGQCSLAAFLHLHPYKLLYGLNWTHLTAIIKEA